MLKEQKILMEDTKKALELLLDADEYMLYPNAAEFELYRMNSASLHLNFQINKH